MELAERGFNIVLVSRSKSKLKEVEKALNAKFPNIKTKVIVMDLGDNPTPETIKTLDTDTKDLDISLVINNAGVISTEKFSKQKIDFINNMMNVNSVAPALVLSTFVNRLRARENRSGIINVDSVIAAVAAPTLANYAASKAFLRSLSLSLAEEEKDKLDILALAPGGINTQMMGFMKNSIPDPTTSQPEQTAANALRDLGQDRFTHGFLPHDAFAWIVETTDSVAPGLLQFVLNRYGSTIDTILKGLRAKNKYVKVE